MFHRACVFVPASALIAAASAIVPDTGPDSTYPWVGPAAGGSGTAIARRSVITAKHATGSAYEALGTIYTASSRIDHPTMDISILVFDQDLPGWHSLGAEAPLGAPITMVGFGRTGVVNPQGTGFDIYWWSGGTRIAAPGHVDLEWYFPGWGPSLITWLRTAGDGAGVSGDSGGGFFIDGKLVGVMSYVFNNSGGSLPDYGFASLNNGVPYMGTGAINLTDPEVRVWLRHNIVPAPCPSDFDMNGFVNGDDFDQFVSMFDRGHSSADFDENTFVNGDDFDLFMLAFVGGC